MSITKMTIWRHGKSLCRVTWVNSGESAARRVGMYLIFVIGKCYFNFTENFFIWIHNVILPWLKQFMALIILIEALESRCVFYHNNDCNFLGGKTWICLTFSVSVNAFMLTGSWLGHTSNYLSTNWLSWLHHYEFDFR